MLEEGYVVLGRRAPVGVTYAIPEPDAGRCRSGLLIMLLVHLPLLIKPLRIRLVALAHIASLAFDIDVAGVKPRPVQWRPRRLAVLELDVLLVVLERLTATVETAMVVHGEPSLLNQVLVVQLAHDVVLADATIGPDGLVMLVDVRNEFSCCSLHFGSRRILGLRLRPVIDLAGLADRRVLLTHGSVGQFAAPVLECDALRRMRRRPSCAEHLPVAGIPRLAGHPAILAEPSDEKPRSRTEPLRVYDNVRLMVNHP